DFILESERDRFHYRVNGVFLMPGESLETRAAELEPIDGSESFDFQTAAGEVESLSFRSWRWRAPMEPGLYPIRVKRTGADEGILLNVFVMVPAEEMRNERLEGYRIGSYPSSSGGPVYEAPRGFVEVTKETQDTLVSPHFRLGQFLCKQEGDFPKYVVLREPLVLKLELLLDRINREGHHAETFHVMSGYRTPYYNHAIGNVPYSRHVWGDAADIFVDADRDGVMDDLDRDGRSDLGDARVLYDIIDGEERSLFASLRSLVGGLGKYRATPDHGPFVHLDTRGRQARW
ncbi:MAG: D-Ala-D-Ala carboxypeptidase family metallohydrolase, partial [Vicinamibacteria bacterium]